MQTSGRESVCFSCSTMGFGIAPPHPPPLVRCYFSQIRYLRYSKPQINRYTTPSAPCPAQKWPMAMGIHIVLTGPSLVSFAKRYAACRAHR